MATSPWEGAATKFERLSGFHYDINESGDEFPRGARCVCESTMLLESHHLATPWGYGTSLFLLGPDEDLLARLIHDPEAFEAATQVATNLPKFRGRLSRGCRMQVGVQHREDTPLREAREVPSLMLAVWGHDEGFSSGLKDRVQHGEVEYTLGEFSNSGELRRACDAGTRLRQQLARAVLDALAFKLPRGLVTEDPTVVAFRVDVPLFTMVHQPAIGGKRGEHVTVCLDAAELHAGSQGAGVYYSAAAGSCFYESPHTRARGSNTRGGTTGMVAGSTGFREGTGPLAAIKLPPVVGSAFITVLPAECGVLHREYLSIDTDESDRLLPCGDNNALEVTRGERMRMRAIATAIVGPLSESTSQLYGRIAVDNVTTVLSYTNPLQKNIGFLNTPEWVTRLTALAPSGKVWELLNEGSAHSDDQGVITHYEIDRAMLTK
jgi:hypothetical protein